MAERRAKKPASRSKKRRVPFTHPTCGMFGGVRGDGSLCGRKAGWGTPTPGYGACKDHLPKPDAHFDNPRKNAYLAALSHTRRVMYSCNAAGITRNTVWRWRQEDEDFVAAEEEAMEMAKELLEVEARRRAVYGEHEPIMYQGEIVGTVAKRSDILLMFLLKSIDPERYVDRHQLSGPGGGPISVEAAQVHLYLPANGREVGTIDAAEPLAQLPKPSANGHHPNEHGKR